MSTQADIPSNILDDKAFVFQYLDAELNSRILYALLHGGGNIILCLHT